MDMRKLSNGYEIWRDISHDYVAASHVRLDSGTHYHCCLEFIYVEDGEAESVISGTKYVCGSGGMILIGVNEQHTSLSHFDGKYHLLMLPRHFFGPYTNLFLEKTFADHILYDDDDRRMLIFFRLLTDIKNKSGTFAAIESETAARNISLAFLETITSRVNMTKRTEWAPGALMIMEYLIANYRENLNMPGLAKALGKNQNDLSREFRMTYGESPISFLNRLRAEEVYRLLCDNPQITLVEAADQVGFGTVQTLLRAFRKNYDLTPDEIRNKRVAKKSDQ